MGPFAKLAQATYLLGCVFRHICDLRVDVAHQEEGMRLSSQLQRHLDVLANENEISATTAMCSRFDRRLHEQFYTDLATQCLDNTPRSQFSKYAPWVS